MNKSEFKNKALTGLILGAFFSLGVWIVFSGIEKVEEYLSRDKYHGKRGVEIDHPKDLPILSWEINHNEKNLNVEVLVKNTGPHIYDNIRLELFLYYKEYLINSCTSFYPYAAPPEHEFTIHVTCLDVARDIPEDIDIQPTIVSGSYLIDTGT